MPGQTGTEKKAKKPEKGKVHYAKSGMAHRQSIRNSTYPLCDRITLRHL